MEQIHTDSICENLCHLWMIFVVTGVSRSCGLFFLSTPAAAGWEISYPPQGAMSASAAALATTDVFTVADGDVAGLIAAIHAANQSGTPGVVNLATNGTYTLTVPDNSFDGGNGLPVITGTITLNGNGSTIARSSADGTAAFRILQISGTLRLDSVTLRNGSIRGEGFRSGSGGAILNLGVLTLTNSTITGNRADRDGGGIANVAFDQNAYLEIRNSRQQFQIWGKRVTTKASLQRARRDDR